MSESSGTGIGRKKAPTASATAATRVALRTNDEEDDGEDEEEEDDDGRARRRAPPSRTATPGRREATIWS
jgi:hypothetical protein